MRAPSASASLGGERADDGSTRCFWYASMTKALVGDRRHAAGRAGPRRARRADRQHPAGSRLAAGARRLRRDRQADSGAGEAADHASPSCSPIRPASATTSGTPTSTATCARTAFPLLVDCKSSSLEPAAGRRPGRQLGIWHQHRLGRAGGRGGQRHVAEAYLVDHLFAPLGMRRHRLHHPPAAEAAARDRPPAAARRIARTDRRMRYRRSRSSSWAAAASTAPPATTRPSSR